MSDDDDRTWVDALAGRAPARGGEAAREGRSLRDGILTRTVAEAPPVRATDPAREAALIERARRVGLLPDAAAARPAGVRPIAARPAWWGGWRGVAALAAAASVVAVVGLVLRPAPAPDETVRGVPGGIARLEADDPAALRRAIVDELAAAGVPATTYERLGRLGIDANLPAPLPEAVAAVLRRHALSTPPDGVLIVEIAPRAAR